VRCSTFRTLRRAIDNGDVTHAALQAMAATAWAECLGLADYRRGLGFTGAALLFSAVCQGAAGDTLGLFMLGVGATLMVTAIVI
jgi:hypothetical protein